MERDSEMEGIGSPPSHRVKVVTEDDEDPETMCQESLIERVRALKVLQMAVVDFD